jgi:hypothetical protein
MYISMYRYTIDLKVLKSHPSVKQRFDRIKF